MQELVLDLHIHSRYSRAVSPRMNLPNMYMWGRRKGINILSVTDYTHPLWFKEAKNSLIEVNEGVYKLKDEERLKGELGIIGNRDFLGPYFMLSVEVSAIYSEEGVSHRIHNLVFAPSFSIVEKINAEFLKRGFNLSADGRPTFESFSTKDLLELLYSIDNKIALIPCHIWTPWFSLYGSRSGYNHLSDCFGKYSKYIFAIETGLSSDPAMNWRIKELESRSIVSFSDAHSLEKMAREATVIVPTDSVKRIKKEDITYSNILNSFVRGKERSFKIGYTIEYYPEEGKYHYTGHRNCGIAYSPQDDKQKGIICPVCRRELTVGVMHRVEELADIGISNFKYETDDKGVVWVIDPKYVRPKYVSLVPLIEILTEALNSGASSNSVVSMYSNLIDEFDSELELLLRTSLEDIRRVGGKKIAQAIEKVRTRNISIKPGFDGEYGHVSIWQENESTENRPLEKQLGFEI